MTLNFIVSHNGKPYTLNLDPTVTVQELKEQLFALTGIPAPFQKLLAKKQLKNEMTLAEVPIVNGSKLMLIGTSQADHDRVSVAKTPLSQLASRPVAVTRRQGGIATIDTIGADTVFGSIKVLDGWPNSEQARSILQKLSTDNSIVQVMKKHGWKVGVLSELTPLEYTKLGYNMNRGAEISLRLRFEDGFRNYDSIKKVLYHELAHMEVDEHNNDFKALNSQIKRECEAVGPGRKVGEGQSYYQPSGEEEEDEELEAVDHGGVGYRLGGDETTPSDAPTLTPSQAAAQAALRRFELAPKPSPTPQQAKPSPSPQQSKPTASTVPSNNQQTTPKPATTNTPTGVASSSTNTTSTQPVTTQNPPPETKSPEQNTSANSQLIEDRSCPICGLHFQASDTERQVMQHVNSCLDKA